MQYSWDGSFRLLLPFHSPYPYPSPSPCPYHSSTAFVDESEHLSTAADESELHTAQAYECKFPNAIDDESELRPVEADESELHPA